MLSKIFQFLLIRQLNENTPLEILNHLQRRLKLKTQTPHYFLHQWKILYFTKFITILKILLYTRVTLKCQKNTTIDIDQLWYYLGNLRHLLYFVKTNQSTKIIKRLFSTPIRTNHITVLQNQPSYYHIRLYTTLNQ